MSNDITSPFQPACVMEREITFRPEGSNGQQGRPHRGQPELAPAVFPRCPCPQSGPPSTEHVTLSRGHLLCHLCLTLTMCPVDSIEVANGSLKTKFSPTSPSLRRAQDLYTLHLTVSPVGFPRIFAVAQVGIGVCYPGNK